tara:strand:+ start:30996 stop:31238 length:243 start_codon:yes stop_codon:yes gene_type:complete
MTNNRADESILASLHDLLAKRLIEKLNDSEVDASTLNAASKFLKDNNILAHAGDDSGGLDELSSILRSFETKGQGSKGAH